MNRIINKSFAISAIFCLFVFANMFAMENQFGIENQSPFLSSDGIKKNQFYHQCRVIAENKKKLIEQFTTKCNSLKDNCTNPEQCENLITQDKIKSFNDFNACVKEVLAKASFISEIEVKLFSECFSIEINKIATKSIEDIYNLYDYNPDLYYKKSSQGPKIDSILLI